MSQQAFHGGAFFEAIGVDLRHLERADSIVSADVLDAWFDPSPRVLERLKQHLPFLLRTSPPNHAEGLVQELALRRSIPSGCILPGAGSSSLLFHCLPRLLPQSPRVLLLDPMYGEYRHLVEHVLGGAAIALPLASGRDFELDLDRLLALVESRRPDALVLVNPNNPTGRLCPRERLLEALRRVPRSTLIVVDETYIEYAGAAHSLESDAAQSPNLIVLKSMSKVYALSGERVAYLVANPKTCEHLRRFLPPWPVGLSAQAAAMEALRDPDYYERKYRETCGLRTSLASGLRDIPGLVVYPSEANFLLIETSASPTLASYLRARDIYVREFPPGQPELSETFLRISVKCASQNQRVLAAIAAFLQ